MIRRILVAALLLFTVHSSIAHETVEASVLGKDTIESKSTMTHLYSDGEDSVWVISPFVTMKFVKCSLDSSEILSSIDEKLNFGDKIVTWHYKDYSGRDFSVEEFIPRRW